MYYGKRKKKKHIDVNEDRFKVKYDGLSGTILDWCKHLGVSEKRWYEKCKQGLEYGEMIEEIKKEVEEERKQKLIEYKGKSMDLNDWCFFIQCRTTSFYSWRKKGCTDGEIIDHFMAAKEKREQKYFEKCGEMP